YLAALRENAKVDDRRARIFTTDAQAEAAQAAQAAQTGRELGAQLIWAQKGPGKSGAFFFWGRRLDDRLLAQALGIATRWRGGNLRVDLARSAVAIGFVAGDGVVGIAQAPLELTDSLA